MKCGNQIFVVLFSPIVEAGYVSVYGRDITERKQAEKELLNSKAQLGAVLDTVGEGIITIDSSSIIVMVNREVQNI